MRERLTALGVPCPLHATPKGLADLEDVAAELGGWPLVLKTTRGGYDGKGVWVVDDARAAEETGVFDAGIPVLAEERVDYARELSALVARSPSGQAIAYPVVESVQRDGICHEVIAPAPGPAGGTRRTRPGDRAADRR